MVDPELKELKQEIANHKRTITNLKKELDNLEKENEEDRTKLESYIEDMKDKHILIVKTKFNTLTVKIAHLDIEFPRSRETHLKINATNKILADFMVKELGLEL
ncbi:MAG: hypothetical protein V3V41_07910 [Candidatus Heimdallarchaeota archaeon]